MEDRTVGLCRVIWQVIMLSCGGIYHILIYINNRTCNLKAAVILNPVTDFYSSILTSDIPGNLVSYYIWKCTDWAIMEGLGPEKFEQYGSAPASFLQVSFVDFYQYSVRDFLKKIGLNFSANFSQLHLSVPPKMLMFLLWWLWVLEIGEFRRIKVRWKV